MSSRGKKTGLVVQEGVMISQEETPVLKLDDTISENILPLVPITVRFLRCGCPSVQWLVTTHDFNEMNMREENWNETMDDIQDALSNLQLSGENFKMERPARKRKQGTVITITRIVTPKTQEMTFGELISLDYFFQSPESPEYLVARDPFTDFREYVAIALNGSAAGQIVHFAKIEKVLKIIK